MKAIKLQIKLDVVGACVLWTVAVILSLAWNIHTQRFHALQVAKTSAIAVFNKDLAFRRWIAGHGGIYVLATSQTPPNPFLAQVPDRDIFMKNGRMLTLMNPAYALRQMTSDYYKFSGTRGHITSLKLLNPVNAPDEWEQKTLESFEHGVKEVSEVALIKNISYMRIMKPLVTESSCLKCHAHQGYKLGDIRGGMSVTEPLKSYLDAGQKDIMAITLSHVLFWLLGMAAIGVATVHINGRIREREKAQKELEESEKKYRELTESLPQPVFEADISGNLTYFNRKAFEKFGFSMEDFNRGINFSDLIVKKDLERAKANFAKKIQLALTNVHEYTARRKDGTTFPVSVYSASIVKDALVTGTRGFAIDLTEHVKAETQFRQAQKMETVGQLAGGVAHDFNNILMAIMGYARFALRALPEDSTAHKDIFEVLKNSERAANLTKQLLAFSRRQRLEPRIADLNPLLTELAKMLRRLIGEHIELAILLEPNLWNVKVDPPQIEQVIINLAVNARDAMPRGGKLTISTANAELSNTPTAEVLIPGGSYVLVSVADTGMGMDEEVKSHLFEPFFTTKEPGKGTGLGLATCYGIIKQSGGYIIAESEQGKGSVFTVYLPRESEETGPAESAEAITELPTGSETVLLAEDDASIRRMISRTLSQQGYRVLEAINGEEALQIVEHHGIENIHLLLTDMVMPLMGGERLAERIRELRPDIKVIFMSGYTDDTLSPFSLDETHAQFIQKPIALDDLIMRIRRMLDRG